MFITVGTGAVGGRSSSAGGAPAPGRAAIAVFSPRQRMASMTSMSIDSGAQERAVPPAAASDDRTAEASPPPSPEQIYQQVMARLAAITDQWQQARDALGGGSPGASADENPKQPPGHVAPPN